MGDPENDQTTNIGLTEAYAVETPDDNRRLYQAWADTYEADFIEPLGYTYHEDLAATVAELANAGDQPILDVGCGTGVIGVALRAIGEFEIDGADISPEMLAVAATKATADGAAVYRTLVPADLTTTLDIAADSYGAVVSAGVFTHGHVSHDALDELYRIARPGALFVLGVNAEHYEQRGFGDRFATDVTAGRITEPELRRVAIYGRAASGDHEHADDEALMAVFRTR